MAEWRLQGVLVSNIISAGCIMTVTTEISALEAEVARLLVEPLNSEDVKPESIDPEAALFRDGLGLDSVDALELSFVIAKEKRVQASVRGPAAFRRLRTLSRHVEQNRVQ